MVKVYYTAQGWCCAFTGGLTYHNHLQAAMDAAYRKANHPPTTQHSNRSGNNS